MHFFEFQSYYNNNHNLGDGLMLFFNCLFDMVGNMTFFTAYISNGNSFLQPLDEKDELIYLKKLKEGDLEAKGILIERNLRLVAHVVKKYSYPGKEVDDLIYWDYFLV